MQLVWISICVMQDPAESRPAYLAAAAVQITLGSYVAYEAASLTSCC